MAIYQHDRRHFQHMMSEIDVETIPLRFIHSVCCVLSDGTTVSLIQQDFSDNNGDLESMVKELNFFEAIEDLQVNIDFDKVETDVTDHVNQILKRTNDQSNPGM